MCETRCGGAIIAMSHIRQAEPFLCLCSRSSSYRILEFWSCRWSYLCQTLFSLNPLRYMMVFGTGCLWSSQLAIHIRLLVSNSSPHAFIPTLMIKVSSVLTSWRTNGRRSTMCDPSFCPSRVCWEVKRLLYTKPGLFKWNLPSYSSWIIQTRKTTKICLMSQSPASQSCVLNFFHAEPNNESPLNVTAAKLWEDQEGRFPQQLFLSAQLTLERYWSPLFLRHDETVPSSSTTRPRWSVAASTFMQSN